MNSEILPSSKFLPNSTQIPNALLDRLMPLLSGDEFKVLMYLARRTFGFQRRADRVSTRQISVGITSRKTGEKLDNGTGLNRGTIMRCLTRLKEHGVVLETSPAIKERNIATEWSINLDSRTVDWYGLESKVKSKAKGNQKRTAAARVVASEKQEECDPVCPTNQGDPVCGTDRTRSVGQTATRSVGQTAPGLSDRPTKEKIKPRETEKVVEEVFVPDGDRFEPSLAVKGSKGRRYSALLEEPTVRDRAITACQALGMTHFSSILGKRREKTGRLPVDADWSDILAWAEYYKAKLGTRKRGGGTIVARDVVGLLVAAIRDAEPPPVSPAAFFAKYEVKDPHESLQETTETVEPETVEPLKLDNEILSPLEQEWAEVKQALALSMTEDTFNALVPGTRLVSFELGLAVISHPDLEVLKKFEEATSMILPRLLSMKHRQKIWVDYVW